MEEAIEMNKHGFRVKERRIDSKKSKDSYNQGAGRTRPESRLTCRDGLGMHARGMVPQWRPLSPSQPDRPLMTSQRAWPLTLGVWWNFASGSAMVLTRFSSRASARQAHSMNEKVGTRRLGAYVQAAGSWSSPKLSDGRACEIHMGVS